jgi:glutamyl-tRNA reductase
MNLILVGLSHKTAPVEIRERIAFQDETLCEALALLHREFGFEEALILSTCNRVEVIARPADGCLRSDRLKDFLHSYHQLRSGCLEPYLYSFAKDDAIRHVFRVASSLDSMVVGESQVLGQLKRAYSLACQSKTAGMTLNGLMHRAFHVAKRVRTETKISSSAVSISYVAVELARKILGELKDRSIFLIGAGKMGELAARNLVRCGVSEVLVTNRTAGKAQEMAQRFSGRAVPYESLFSQLGKVDIAIVSTGAEGYVLRKAEMQQAVRERRYRPIFVIDISVPRNVDPEINDLEEVFLYDIDDLQSVIHANLEERRKEADQAEEIISQEVEIYSRKIASRDASSLIAALRHRLEEICLEELEKSRNTLSAEEYQRALRRARVTAHRLAHPFIVELKNPNGSPSRYQHQVELIKRVFHLEEKE